MKKKSYILTLLAAASALLLASCAKMGTNGDGNDGAPLSFSSRAEGTVEVKGTLVSGAITSFTAAGYDGIKSWFPKTDVTTSDTYADYKWKSGKSYTFFGYANVQPAVATATIMPSYVQLDYNAVPESAADQQDILLGYYSGNGGGEGKADMKFYHPLASVQFKVGTITNVESITEISIDGVYGAGQTQLLPANISGEYATFEWKTAGDPITVSQTTSVSTFTTDASIGTPFILIPQTLSNQAVTVKMTVSLSGNITKIVSAELSTGAFVAGKTTAIKVNYDGGNDLNFTATVTEWVNSDASQGITMAKRTAPDPDYWVDLGMVSDNGKKMYVSKYDVKSVSNGVATFETGPTVNSIPQAVAQTITKSQDGQECRVMSGNEYIALSIPSNFTVTATGTTPNRVFTFTSKMTGLSDGFDHSVNYAEGWYVVGDYGGNAPIYYIFDNNYNSDYMREGNHKSDGPIKLICETDEDVPTVKSLKIYIRFYHGYHNEFIFSDCTPSEDYGHNIGKRDLDCTNKSFSGYSTEFPEGCLIRPVLVYENGYEYHNRFYSSDDKYYKIERTTPTYECYYSCVLGSQFPMYGDLYDKNIDFTVSHPGVESVTFSYMITP